MKTKFIGIEIIVFIALPYFIWNYARDYTGDYYAMLLSTVPGFFYTIFRFSKDRQFNVGGLFILISLFIGTLVDLLSGSAVQMLWNSVWLGFAYTVVYLSIHDYKKTTCALFCSRLRLFTRIPPRKQ